MKTVKLIRTAGLCLTIIICITIFLFSAAPAETSKQQSGGIAEVVVSVLYGERDEFTDNQYTEIYNRVDHVVRKAAHFSAYLCLGFCVLAFACTFNIKSRFKIGSALIFCVLYAASDEFHQLFVPGRSGQISDVLLDSAGATAGILISYIIIYMLIIYKLINKEGDA